MIGILSYPRTETDFFKEGTELLPLLQEQRNHNSWGEYTSSLLNIDVRMLLSINSLFNHRSSSYYACLL